MHESAFDVSHQFVTFADTSGDAVAAISKQLAAGRSEEEIQNRKQYAALNSWRVRAAKVKAILEDALVKVNSRAAPPI